MFALFEWMLDISLTLAGAAATGSIFLMLLQLGGVARTHFVRHQLGMKLANAGRVALHRKLPH
jgi:hypothetical protein